MAQEQVAIYAPVSSDQQAQEGTIDSQLAALRERVEADGLSLSQELTFIDEGDSGANLIGPGVRAAAGCGCRRVSAVVCAFSRPLGAPLCLPGAAHG